jgi:hypothetical protein
MLTVAVAFLSGSAVLVAVTVTTVGDATVGATKSPAFEIEPPVDVQTTAEFFVPETETVKFCVPCEDKVTSAGSIETRTFT